MTLCLEDDANWDAGWSGGRVADIAYLLSAWDAAFAKAARPCLDLVPDRSRVRLDRAGVVAQDVLEHPSHLARHRFALDVVAEVCDLAEPGWCVHEFHGLCPFIRQQLIHRRI